MALPPNIEMLISIIGHGATMSLVREFGGDELRVPRGEGNDTWAALVEVIGEKATRKLSAAFGIEREIYIANCTDALRQERNRRLIARYETLVAEGFSGRSAVSVLVREFRPLSNRQIQTIINAPTPEPTAISLQAELF